MVKMDVNTLIKATSTLFSFIKLMEELGIPIREFSVDYDEEADVLYITFGQKATDTEFFDEGILVRYKGDRVVGITVLNASKLGSER